MVLPRRRTLGGDDEMDITVGFDDEKHQLMARDASIELYSEDCSPASSRSEYNPQDGILHEAPPVMAHRRRFSRSSVFFHVPNRPMRWLCFALGSTIIIFILMLIRMSQLETRRLMGGKETPPPPAPWESFPFLQRYNGGIRSLQPVAGNTPEYPHSDEAPMIKIEANVTTFSKGSFPVSKVYNPYPDYKSSAYISEHGEVKECFLDDSDTIPVPKIKGYEGAVHGMPAPIMGSYELMGIPDSMCYERYGRLGPYGYGYSQSKGGIGGGLHGDKDGFENTWKSSPQIDYRPIRWADAQNRCYRKNQHRFRPRPEGFEHRWLDMPPLIWGNATPPTGEGAHGELKPRLPRTAIVIRTWHTFKWTQEEIVYMRSLISELSLLSGGEYQVHFLIQVKDHALPIWADDEVYIKTLRDALPSEFYGMGTLWSERQMLLIYDGLEETFMRGLPVHGVYRSAHFPLQYFAYKHPEYDYFWNWELDIRYTGHWYKLFESLRSFAKEQPRKGLWERNQRFYVPSVHGSWDDFKQMVRVQSEMPTPQTNKWAHAGPDGGAGPVAEPPVWGPKRPKDGPVFEDDPQPPTTYREDRYVWGVGEEADLITMNPMFNPEYSGWLLTDDTTGYNTSEKIPRRTAIITAGRLSRRLLVTMHRETSTFRHSMFSEMFPSSIALHHGYKAVYAPHPVFVDRAWPPAYVAKTFNGGFNGAAGGARTSVFNDERQHNFLGMTWYYRTGFPAVLWRRWLGQKVNNDGGEEFERLGEGRMCLPPMLLHPIRDFDFVIEEPNGKKET